MDPQKPGYIQTFVDTKNYSRASNMFGDLGQFKAYLREIDSFDQLYIIQQGGREVTREQIIAQLERVIAKDAENVFNPTLTGKIIFREFSGCFERSQLPKLLIIRNRVF